MLHRCVAAILLCAVLACGKNAAPLPPPPPVTPPAAPSQSLVATGGKGRISLSWAPVAGASSYSVRRSAVSGSGYAEIGSSTSGAYVDAQVAAGARLYYVVRAVNAAGASPDSAELSALTVPAPPANLSATASASGIALGWAVSAGAATYNLYRSTTSGSGYAAVTTATTTGAVDTTGADATTYYFVVRAADASGESDASPEARVTTLPALPGAVSNLAATPGAGSVSLAWDTAAGATSYAVLRSSGSGPAQQIAAPAANRYVDGSLPANTSYSYSVAAINARGQGARSAPVSALTAPAAVEVHASAKSGATSVQLSWYAPDGAARFAVSRSSTAGIGYAPLATTGSTIYEDTTAPAGARSYYVVVAANSAGTAAPQSQEVSALPAPAAPVLQGVAAGSNGLTVSWAASPYATGYSVQRANSSGGPYSEVGATAALQYTDASVAGNTSYWYAIKATNGTYGPLSSAASGLSAPAAPVLSGTMGNNFANLSWGAVDGAVSYSLYRDGALLIAQSGTSYCDSTAQNGKTYSYTVAAKSSAGVFGAASAAVVITPSTAIVDASNYAASTGSIAISPGQQPGELIPVSTSGELQGIELALARLNTTPGTSVRLRVFNGPFQLLGSATIPYASIPSSPPTLSANTTQSGYFDLTSQHINVSPGQVLRAVLDADDGGYFGAGSSARIAGAAFSMTMGGNGSSSGDLIFKSMVRPSFVLSGTSPPIAHQSVGQVDLYWTASTGTQGYGIYRRVPGSGSNRVGSTAGTSFSDTTVAPGVTYLYSIFSSTATQGSTSPETTVTAPRLAVDQSNLFRDMGVIGCTSAQRLGQSITVGANGKLIGIEVRLAIDPNSTQRAGNVILRLSDQTGNITATVQRSASELDGGDTAMLDPRFVGTGYFDLSQANIAVTMGQRFIFEVSTDTALNQDQATAKWSGLGLSIFQTPATTDGTANGPRVYNGGIMWINGRPYPYAYLQFKTFVQ